MSAEGTVHAEILQLVTTGVQSRLNARAGSSQPASERSSLGGNHQDLARLEHGGLQAVELDDPLHGPVNIALARGCSHVPQGLPGPDGRRRRPAGSVRRSSAHEAGDHDPQGDGESEHEHHGTQDGETTQPDRQRARRAPDAPPRGLSALRNPPLRLDLTATLSAHGRVPRCEIRGTRPRSTRRPLGSLAPFTPGARRPWGGGAPDQLRGKLDGLLRPGATGGRAAVQQAEMRTGGGRDGTRTEGRMKGAGTHEDLLEHMFDEHLFDTIATSGSRVQSIFEHTFEFVVIPP